MRVGWRRRWIDLEVRVIESSRTFESPSRIERQETFDEVKEGVCVIRVGSNGVLNDESRISTYQQDMHSKPETHLELLHLLDVVSACLRSLRIRPVQSHSPKVLGLVGSASVIDDQSRFIPLGKYMARLTSTS